MLLFIIVFSCISVFEYFRATKKNTREKWALLLLIIGISLWNLMAYCFKGWPNPNNLIIYAYGWVDTLLKPV